MSETRVILPPDINFESGLVAFLAGPIQGASHWQNEAITLFKERNFLLEGLTIASPRRNDETWQFQYEAQVNWETHYLNRAALHGAILFWLSKEFEHDCGRAYAQTTRYELGEWLAKSETFKTPIVVGIEPGFTGERYVRHRLSHGDFKHIPITNTLEETVEATLHVLTYIDEE